MVISCIYLVDDVGSETSRPTALLSRAGIDGTKNLKCHVLIRSYDYSRDFRVGQAQNKYTISNCHTNSWYILYIKGKQRNIFTNLS